MIDPTTRQDLELLEERENKTGPCACCGEVTPYLHNQRDEDGQYYCEMCCHIAEAEAAYDCYLAGLADYEHYLAMNAYTNKAPRPRREGK